MEGAWSSWSSGGDQFLSTLDSSFFRICALDIIGEGNRHLVIRVEGKAFLVLYLILLDGPGIPLEGLLEPTKSLEDIPVKNYHDCMLKCPPRRVLDLLPLTLLKSPHSTLFTKSCISYQFKSTLAS